jgi:hypothetical protein
MISLGNTCYYGVRRDTARDGEIRLKGFRNAEVGSSSLLPSTNFS